MKTKLYELKTLVCEDGKFCDNTMNIIILLGFGSIVIQSIWAIT
jgi:hypothetical protein|tara:strand:+ start:425 stop:556 length:132 start_codon:yes stop_codon:yes gene_type:complete